MMGRLRQGRSWDEAHVSGLYTQQHQTPFWMAMQQSNNHGPYSLIDSPAAPTAQLVSGSEASSSGAESRVSSQFETIPPPFIDFLGVGAT